MKQLYNSISLNQFELKHINEQLSSINFNSLLRKNLVSLRQTLSVSKRLVSVKADRPSLKGKNMPL